MKIIYEAYNRPIFPTELYTQCQHENEKFFKYLQEITNGLKNDKPIMLMGDINAIITNNLIPPKYIKQNFNEELKR